MAEKSRQQQEGELLITRIIDAPRQMVFKAFTERDHMANWWGPKGSDIDIFQFELTPGGVFYYRLRMENDFTMWAKFLYHEIEAPERVVFTSSFSDEKGNLAKAPFPGLDFPLEVRNTWTFTEKNGKTVITLHAVPVNATASEFSTFVNLQASMHEGYAGTFDKLEEYLSKIFV